ncbi:MAG: NADH:flavin oxidoreductase [Syntrophobacteraceae bacterium]|jgi:2,4-dienoyl-CoA reductase-like NADH-dependent reductase (Old Yellow Enzyme family)
MIGEVFEPTVLAGIPLRNRIIRSATHEGMADERGYPTEALKQTYLRLAKGNVGAIITGYAGVQPNGKSPLYRMLMIDNDEAAASYEGIVQAVHANNTSIVLQIAHCGRQTRSKIIGERPVAPSAIRDKFYNEDLPKELTSEEIEALIVNFVNAIERARRAGFDGVQLHAAHGYLLSQFLSPYMNRRQDKWGGTTENRFRILHEIYTRARERVGDFPILIKINAYDGRRQGMRLEEAVRIARRLEHVGCSGIEISCGTSEDGFYTVRGAKAPLKAVFNYTFRYKSYPAFFQNLMLRFANFIIPPVAPLKNYNVDAAQEIKSQLSIPVIVVGGITSLDDIAGIIENNKADAVSMSRPFIIEPNIVKKFQEGVQRTSKCIACNYCLVASEERPLRCYYGKLDRSLGNLDEKTANI